MGERCQSRYLLDRTSRLPFRPQLPSASAIVQRGKAAIQSVFSLPLYITPNSKTHSICCLQNYPGVLAALFMQAALRLAGMHLIGYATYLPQSLALHFVFNASRHHDNEALSCLELLRLSAFVLQTCCQFSNTSNQAGMKWMVALFAFCLSLLDIVRKKSASRGKLLFSHCQQQQHSQVQLVTLLAVNPCQKRYRFNLLSFFLVCPPSIYLLIVKVLTHGINCNAYLTFLSSTNKLTCTPILSPSSSRLYAQSLPLSSASSSPNETPPSSLSSQGSSSCVAMKCKFAHCPTSTRRSCNN